ncbi:MAG: preprotein translocase subunit SecA [Desulfobacteraceae bacterium]|nr:preprotein translocase subunit SecA [Desulfobacteraceae bacterium]MBC2754491.1 preprotein translocase subunit SecA [Desulfobacteraceae bacterium]
MSLSAVNKFLLKIFGSKNERVIKQYIPLIESINLLESDIKALSDSELAGQTQKLKSRYQSGVALDDLLPEAFATVREATWRTLRMRHFDVQLIGGMVLHEGNIAEMKTGEGKTLIAPLAAYLNSLTGKGVHVITVNDYLARRDAEWMGKVFTFLGLTVGAILHGMDDAQRKAAYNADITYGTNNEFGFDYLRDNMKFEKEALVQRDLHFAVVDEVDSILIDEARTPLIISGPAEKSTHLYYEVNNIVPHLKPEEHYTVDEKSKASTLTEEGVATAEKLLKVDNLYDTKNIDLLHHVNQALKAHAIFTRDVDYIVKDGEVIIVDEFTGRLMPGRRYSEGLHQALEAKEKVKIENENQTLATITFQNYFRMYDKLSGMTGTAYTEAAEFGKIYGLGVAVIPTNQPMIRNDFPDVIYRTRREKFEAVLDEIVELHKAGQPVLVGTVNIDVSEDVSRKLKKRGVRHNVLNAKNHAGEAEIIANAGQKGAVTISTNMAGRGTDIVLGEGVTDLGGLHIIGTERHESRRIDNQLRGRSGRQGDPGSSRFYLALEDDLLRIFGGERISGIMSRLGMQEGEPIEHKMISRAIENAQSKVEGHNFNIRKQLLEYDDVMNQQREVIYKQRHQAITYESLRPVIDDMISDFSEEIVSMHADEKMPPREWDIKGLTGAVFKQFNFRLNLAATDETDESDIDQMTMEKLSQTIYDTALFIYNQKEARIGALDFRNIERIIMLQTMDNLWKDHLLSMDHLKEGIGLRSYAQQNPLMIYKKEAFEMFQEMVARVREETITILFRIQIAEPSVVNELSTPKEQEMNFSHSDSGLKKAPVVRDKDKVGRNDPCPCGSGKKYKKCCGK